MANHQYTIVTSQGDVNLNTPHHHSTFQTIEEFLKAHKATIDSAIGVTQIVIQVYTSHNRQGNRIK